MSGHSKWASIKHQKGAKDKARGKLFAKLIRQVEVTARQGGSDLDSNATLRTMYQKARDASVPLDTIERAIKRGTGELEGVRYEPVSYEGYAPCGVAVYVEVLSDNRNRTGADVRSLFSRNGGSLAEPGAVAWQFERKGVVVLPKQRPEGRGGPATEVAEDDVLLVVLDAGADDLSADGDTWRVTCPPTALPAVEAALGEADLPVDSAEVTMVPTTTVDLETPEDAKKVLRLIDALDDHDDVQGVYANFDVADDVLQAVEA
ncbi:MAG: YebC/PmpR family DNA-binding transcriptional regulator [Acidimicrobiales bacterium]